MKNLLLAFLTCLLFLVCVLPAAAQNETCPRTWRSNDTLFTDPAPALQWYKNDSAIPGANGQRLEPTEKGRYAIESTSEFSPVYAYDATGSYELAGYVFDELHRPIHNAIVRFEAYTSTTDSSGRFVLSITKRKPDTFQTIVISVEKDGYWRNASRQYLHEQHRTETQIMLHTQRVTNWVDATKGGEMAYRGYSLQIPPNAVQTESGSPYSGTILLSVEGALPSEPDFGLRMPGGDFSAIDENGNNVMLYSYGYVSVEMESEGGEKLELRPEARATLRFQLPYTENLRPDSVPLWHFDTERAIWEQVGWSYKNGSIYEGNVSHFSSWNLDIPAERSTCKGRVIDCNNEPVRGGWVRVGQRQIITDSLGNYRTFVPGGIIFDAFAAVDTLREITVPAQQERTLDDLTGRDFTGIAVWNPNTQILKINLTGNVPVDLRISLDDGQSWTQEREFASITQAPESVHVDGACTDQLRVVVIGRQEDCRRLSAEELSSIWLYQNWEEALTANKSVNKIRLSHGSFGEQWELLDYFSCLAVLSLESNELNDLPESMGNLTNLQYLELSSNQLTGLPESIGNLSNLQDLTLFLNQLTDLPETIGNLTNLQTLGLAANQLTDLPETFGNLSNLQLLSLNENKLTDLPESFGNLSNLQTLNLEYNQLTDLPESIGNLNNLQTLFLMGNPIPIERRAAIQAMLPNTTISW